MRLRLQDPAAPGPGRQHLSTIRPESDPRIESILRYLRAMNSTRGDVDSIGSSTQLSTQYLQSLARNTTDVTDILKDSTILAMIPEVGSVNRHCTGSGPCSTPGYYECRKCAGAVDEVLTMDLINPGDAVCLNCMCRDKAALLTGAKNYLGLLRQKDRIILTGVHREHMPMSFAQLSRPSADTCA